MKVGIYLRISLDQTGEGLGVSRQLEDCVEHAKMLGWEVEEVYRDNDISATSGKVRPDYRRMLADVDAGRIQGIIAWHADRLYRKASDLGELVDVCKRNNTQIATVRAGTIDLTTPTGRLVAGLLAQVATYEGEAKADRWKRSWRQGREAGKPARTGSRLYGYTRESELIPEEAEIARRMANDVLTGASMISIARWLKEEGIVATRGNTWTLQSIKRYLCNPRLAGYSTLKGEIVGEGRWEPIFDRETWESVRAILTSRTREYVPRKSVLTGLLMCGNDDCGHRMITSGYRGKRSYRCPSRPDMPGCGRVSGTAEYIEEVVIAYAQARLSEPTTRARVEELRGLPTGSAQRELAELEVRVRELEHQLDEPGTPVATILRAIDRTKERQEQLIADIASSPRVPLPRQGGDWPDDLRRQRALIDVVVKEVRLLPRPTPGNRFDPERVIITPR